MQMFFQNKVGEWLHGQKGLGSNGSPTTDILFTVCFEVIPNSLPPVSDVRKTGQVRSKYICSKWTRVALRFHLLNHKLELLVQNLEPCKDYMKQCLKQWRLISGG